MRLKQNILKNEEIIQENKTNLTQEQDLNLAYKEIGETLLCAEAYFFKVGIAWLGPTAKVRNMRKKCFAPLEEFIKVNLTNISTNNIRSYADDLNQLDINEDSSNKLHIGQITFFERYALTLLILVISLAIPILTNKWITTETFIPNILSFFVAIIATAFSLFNSSENCRRSDFHWIICKELNRRRGVDKPNMNRLSIYAIPRTSFPE